MRTIQVILAVAVLTAASAASVARDRTACICHVPPGNPGNAHTICIGASAVRAHLRHGDTLGACPVRCGGEAGDTCANDQFCESDDGACSENAEGTCKDLPTICTGQIAPVCGCNGVTYDNACLAAAAGVNVASAGACAGGCGGASGATCEPNQFCKGETGACDADAEGTCTDIPEICPPIYAPVCGCDGTTYSSECYAETVGITVAAEGACVEGAACGGTEGDTCDEGEFCNPQEGDCAENAPGTCTVMTGICPLTVDPVCGCDGTTYPNSCLAASAGVGVNHTGECESDQTACGGSEGGTCDAGEFCNRPEGNCAEDAAGVCETQPGACPGNVVTVCGCDGNTYSNPCVANAVGVAIESHGVCVPDRVCHSNGECGTGRFCKRPQGACTEGAAGVCRIISLFCSPVIAEVCGCDGNTYPNACTADFVGVPVAHTGVCP